MRMQRVTIIGTGLIGGSLALALKRAFPGLEVAGVDKPEVLERARRLNIIDSIEPRPSDLVVLAAPVGGILKLLDQFATETTLVTDVGSTKAAVCSKAERIGVPFVGGHPMAGLEHSGPDAANAELFQNAPYFLCRIKSTPDGAIERMSELAEAVGAIPQIISPENHDRLVAQISHLPQIVSTALADQTAAYSTLAGPGLRSMTRLAASPFHVWRDIFKTSGFLPQELQTFVERLQRILDALEAGKFDELETLFKSRSSE
jgi:prephenate dehydrogenase